MNKFFSIVDAHKREGTVIRAVLGNHEYYDDPSKAESNLMEAGGYDSPDVHLTIDGYHFILISPNMGGEGFDETKQNWLAEELRIAAEDDPTGNKPIFVFQHQHVSNTVYGSKNRGVDHLRNILNEYPQVVDFSGNSHYPINDPRSVWQGEFTALGTGTLSFYRMEIEGTQIGEVTPGTNELYWKGESPKDAAQFYIVEVDANNSVNVQAFDLFTSTFIMEPIVLNSVGDPTTFIYTNARRTSAKAPNFGSSELYKNLVVKNGSVTVTVSINQAECEDMVQCYRFTLYEGKKAIASTYRLSSSFYFPTPETITASFSGLKPEISYFVEVIAVSSWGKESLPESVNVYYVFAN